eukprot:11217219-Lingulodinium_polyedra.AAC.1
MVTGVGDGSGDVVVLPFSSSELLHTMPELPARFPPPNNQTLCMLTKEVVVTPLAVPGNLMELLLSPEPQSWPSSGES